MKYNDNSNWIIVGETGGEPVSLDELKAHLNMSFSGVGNYSEDDDYLESLIQVSREAIENYCGISIKGRTVQCIARNECGGVELPWGPVFSVSSAVDVYGQNVNITTVGDKWRTILSPEIDYIKITYVTGFMKLGFNSTPKALKHAILEECAWRYANRGATEGVGSSSAKSLCSPYKRKSWLM